MLKKILLVGRIDSTYIEQLGRQLKKYFDVYLLDITNFLFLKFDDDNRIIFEVESKKKKFLPFLFLQRIKVANQLINYIKKEYKFDCLHYHYAKYEYLFLYKKINKLAKRIYITVWGSDFHSNPYKRFFKNFYSKACNISFTKKTMLDEFAKYYRLNTNYSMIKMGLEQLDYIDNLSLSQTDNFKQKHNIQANEIVVAVGSCASKNENQLAIFEFFLNNLQNLNNYKLHLVLPLTYGGSINPKILQKVEEIKQFSKVTVLTEFLSYEDLAAMRMVSDVYINNRNNDQFAAAMIEHLYSGTVVMHGSWLDYPLKEMGAYFYTYSGEKSFIEHFLYILENIAQEKEKSKINKDIFGSFTKWENTINTWLELYKD